jgi:hypothetical protein
MPAQTVLEELAREELTRDHVQKRVDDWAKRIESLYGEVDSWLPIGWTANRGAPVTMDEELMAKVGVPPLQLPTLELVHDGEVKVRLRPYGLWIIGTNGRLDLIKGQDRYLILDHARAFEAAEWHVAASSARRKSRLLDDAWFRALLGA